MKSKRSTYRIFDWPAAEAELARGVDLVAFRYKLARLFADQAQDWWDADRHADAVSRLTEARSIEELSARRGLKEAYP